MNDPCPDCYMAEVCQIHCGNKNLHKEIEPQVYADAISERRLKLLEAFSLWLFIGTALLAGYLNK